MKGDQWLRRAVLAVVPESGPGLDLSALHFRFTIRQADVQTPNTCDIRVYNLSEETAARIKKEFTRVVLQAGYEDGNFGIIFDGTIKQVRRGRESATDTYLDISAADGDLAYNFATVNQTLAAGSTPGDHIEAAWKSLEACGIVKGPVPDNLDGAKLPRGKVMFGMARDCLRTAADTTGTSWSIQNGQLNILSRDGYLPGEAVVLTAATGLIGVPEQIQDGIRARCLLNPMLKIGGRVQIDNKSVQQMRMNLGYKAINFFPKIADDGFYRLLVVEHFGDTRGNEWYSDLICLALGDALPMTMITKVLSNG